MLNIPKEVKELFEKDSVRKNVRIHFPNGERADITNSNLIAESFSFTESVMSQSEFRFGLCEASMVEFECFGVENIKDYEIEAYHEIDISSLGEEFIAEYGMTSEDVVFPFYRVPYGKFKVDEALRQADMVRRNVTAYGNMLEGLQPNRFELMKGKQVYSLNGEYTIDLIKYLYSNMPGYNDIPNAVYSQSEYDIRETEIDLYYDGSYLVIENVRKFITSDNIVKIEPGKKLKTNEQAFNEILEYAEENNPGLFSYLIEAWEDGAKYELDYVGVPSGASTGLSWKKQESIKEEENPFYLYSGLPYISPTTYMLVVSIAFSIKLVDKNGNVLISVDLRNKDNVKIYEIEMSTPQIELIYPFKKGKDGYYIKDIPYDTFPQLIEEAIELYGKFGKVDRYGNFQMISVNQNFGLTPSKTLVPSNTLVPRGIKGEVLQKGNYSSLWYDDFKTKPYDRVSVSYKNSDEEEIYAEHLIVDIESDTYNASDYQAYSLTENTLIQNGTFTEEQITEILETVAESLIGLQYMPFEMDCVGLPYLEAGDAVSVETQNGGFQTLVLDRRIDGIQSLKDNLNAN